LTEGETRYSQIEKEALVLPWACERLDLYLIGREFTIFTKHPMKANAAAFLEDHKAERYINAIECSAISRPISISEFKQALNTDAEIQNLILFLKNHKRGYCNLPENLKEYKLYYYNRDCF